MGKGNNTLSSNQRRDLRRFEAACAALHLSAKQLYEKAALEAGVRDGTLLNDLGALALAKSQGRPVDYPQYVRNLMNQVRKGERRAERHAKAASGRMRAEAVA